MIFSNSYSIKLKHQEMGGNSKITANFLSKSKFSCTDKLIISLNS